MSKKILLVLLFLLSSSVFANLPYFPINFPRDAGAHYKNIPYQYDHLIEWWYFNGRVTTNDGKHLSYDVAFFNSAINMGNIYTQPMLHIQVSDLDQHKSFGTAKTYSLGSGNLATDKLDITLGDEYKLQEVKQNGKTVYLLKAVGNNLNYQIKMDLVLEPISQPLLINGNGLMPMSDTTNSYYYSIPRFKTSGQIKINDVVYEVKNEAGDTWSDHQWGDFDVEKNGWEWFSIRLENGLIANIFLVVEFKSRHVVTGLANIILPNGETRFMPYKDFIVTRDNDWIDPKTSIHYPMTFNFKFPELGLEMTNVAAFSEQQVNGYWEGYCNTSAIYNKQAVNGFSFAELVYETPVG